jgi:hypothetical protein
MAFTSPCRAIFCRSVPRSGFTPRSRARVEAVARATRDKLPDDGRDEPFAVRYRKNGKLETLAASAVIDTSGTWFSPNPLGANGLAVDGEENCAAAIATGIPDVRGVDRPLYEGRATLVVGSGGGGGGARGLNELVGLSGSDGQKGRGREKRLIVFF